MQLMVYIYYRLLIFKNDNSKCTATSQKRYFNSILLFYIFIISCTKKYHVYSLYRISYTLSFFYVMYYVVSEMCFGGGFSEDCFYCYSQQIITTVTNESLIPYNLLKQAPEIHNL